VGASVGPVTGWLALAQRGLCRLLLAWLACWALPAAAAITVPADLASLPLRAEVRVLEDPSGRLGIAEIRSADLEGRFRSVPGAGDLNWGFTRSALWLRLEFQAQGTPQRPALLQVAYPQLDRVDFHTVERGQPVHLVSGDLLPFSARPWPHRHIVFPLQLEPGTTQTVYLRAVSRGSLTVPLTLWSPKALQHHDQSVYAAHALYFGMLLALGLYNLLLFASVRDRLHLAYVANLATFAIGMLGVLGLGHQFLWPELPQVADKIPLLGFSLYGFFAMSYVRAFLDTRSWTPWWDRVLVTLALLFLVVATCDFFTDTRLFVMALAAMAPLAALASLVVGLLALRHNQPGARIYVLASLVYQIGFVAYGLRMVDLVPTNVVTSYAIQWGSVVEMMLLSFALAERLQALRRAKEQAQAEVLQARQAAVQALVDAEKRLESRIAERTAELAQANESLREGQLELSRLALQDSLTGLANRIHLQEHLRLALARSRRSGSGCGLLMIDLDGFKAVNDTHGHAVGDALLQEVARRLRSQVRASDLVARLGGDEFVVVFEPAGNEELARALGHKLVAALGQPYLAGDRSFTIGASIGIALAPLHGTEPQSLLERADQAMYEAKRLGKGRCALARPAHGGSA
jgi:diguanylate cyclase (GGDEF)-like protein